MKLTQLEPKLLRYERTAAGVRHRYRNVRMANAQGVMFLCPKCYLANGGAVGTHAVVCWSRSRGVPEDAMPGPGRWKLVGTSLEDLTLDADPPNSARSVLLTSGCGWHGFVTNGEVS